MKNVILYYFGNSNKKEAILIELLRLCVNMVLVDRI